MNADQRGRRHRPDAAGPPTVRSVLALPKGHPDGEESPLEAALREVREEAGVQAEVVDSLGEVSTGISAAAGGSRRSSSSSC